MPTNGWERFRGGQRAALPMKAGEEGDRVQPGGVRDKDGLTTLYYGQRGGYKCLAIDPDEEAVVGVGRGTSMEKARDKALGQP